MIYTKIVEANLADLTVLRTISITTFTDTFGAQNTPEDLQNYLDSAYSPAQLTAELTDSQSHFYLVYLEEKAVGYLKLNIDNAQTETMGPQALEIERIYILSTFKHRGLGSALLEQATKAAREFNKSKIWLGVWEHNFAAQQFYAKLGFTQTGQHTFMLGTDPQTDLILTKQLSSTTEI